MQDEAELKQEEELRIMREKEANMTDEERAKRQEAQRQEMIAELKARSKFLENNQVTK